jgi:hypothetical protein
VALVAVLDSARVLIVGVAGPYTSLDDWGSRRAGVYGCHLGTERKHSEGAVSFAPLRSFERLANDL